MKRTPSWLTWTAIVLLLVAPLFVAAGYAWDVYERMERAITERAP